MNIPEQTAPNHETGETRLLRRAQIDARRKADTIAAYAGQLAEAKRAHEAAGEAFIANPAPDNARAIALAAERVRNLTAVEVVAEDHGGPEQIRVDALRTYQTFAHLAKAFADRTEEIVKRIQPARRALAEKIGILIEEGLAPALAHVHPDIVPLRTRIEALERAAQDANVLASYCRNWKPDDRRETVDSLIDRAESPLPV